MEWNDEAVVLAARTLGETSVVLSLLTRDARPPCRAGARRRRSAGARHAAAGQPRRLPLARPARRTSGHVRLRAWTRRWRRRCWRMRRGLAAVVAACAVTRHGAAGTRAAAGAISTAGWRCCARSRPMPAWPAAYVRWELALLADLGFGLDLSALRRDRTPRRSRLRLATHRPRRLGRGGRALAATGCCRCRLSWSIRRRRPTAADIAAGLALTGHFLRRCVYAEHERELPAAPRPRCRRRSSARRRRWRCRRARARACARPPRRPRSAAIDDVPLAEAITERYLTYAVSTIVGRSLPDARDGLKPVHRRLL